MVKPYSGFNSFSPAYERNADYFEGVEPEKLLLMLRTRAGLTQSEMGSLIGLSGRMIINWEAGYNLPRPEALRRVIELLLNRGVFTRGKENQEALKLWQGFKDLYDNRRGRSFNTAYPLFDEAWFNALLTRATNVIPSSSPSSSVENFSTKTFKPAKARVLPAPNNLPAQFTRFIGRQEELAELKVLLTSNRLLTLSGVGGVGKTRLALELAGREAGNFREGVWLVALAPLTDPRLVALTTSRALQLPETAGATPLAALLENLKNSQLLLILDNCEHLSGACAELVQNLMQTCPELKILVTSREPLGMAGETVWRVPSLSFPVSDLINSHFNWKAQEPENYEAIRLFVDRAKAALPAFQMTPHNIGAIARICEKLDGIPLALELAAARVGALSVEQLANRLEERFRLLTTGNRTAPPRHRTLQALIDWSYDLLSENEKSLLRCLAVFRGGWTLGGAEELGGSTGKLDKEEVVLLLVQLVNKSLVVAQQPGEVEGTGEVGLTGGELRYTMLETIRQYALEKLVVEEEAAKAQACHFAYFLNLAEKVASQLQGPLQDAGLRCLAEDYDNLREALRWALLQTYLHPFFRLCNALAQFWVIRGYQTESRNWLETHTPLLEESALPLKLAAQTRYWAGFTAIFRSEFNLAVSHLEESLRLWRQLENGAKIIQTLTGLGFALGNALDYPQAHRSFEEALSLSRQAGDKAGQVSVMTFFSALALRENDPRLARVLLEEALELNREVGDKFSGGHAFHTLAWVCLREGNYRQAEDLYLQALVPLAEIRHYDALALLFNNLAELAAHNQQWARAGQLGKFSEKLIAQNGYVNLPLVNHFNFKLEECLGHLSEIEFQQALAGGEGMSLDDALIFLNLNVK